MSDWQVYRTRFLVRARRLAEPLTFRDVLGREQSGRCGDYLVESSEGLLSIAPREIFEDIYVAMNRLELSSAMRNGFSINDSDQGHQPSC